MQDYEIVAIVMGCVALGIGLFFGIMIRVIYKAVKHEVKTNPKIQKKILDLADEVKVDMEGIDDK